MLLSFKSASLVPPNNHKVTTMSVCTLWCNYLNDSSAAVQVPHYHKIFPLTSSALVSLYHSFPNFNPCISWNWDPIDQCLVWNWRSKLSSAAFIITQVCFANTSLGWRRACTGSWRLSETKVRFIHAAASCCSPSSNIRFQTKDEGLFRCWNCGMIFMCKNT